jgi:hypothetical protein
MTARCALGDPVRGCPDPAAVALGGGVVIVLACLAHARAATGTVPGAAARTLRRPTDVAGRRSPRR